MENAGTDHEYHEIGGSNSYIRMGRGNDKNILNYGKKSVLPSLSKDHASVEESGRAIF